MQYISELDFTYLGCGGVFDWLLSHSFNFNKVEWLLTYYCSREYGGEKWQNQFFLFTNHLLC